MTLIIVLLTVLIVCVIFLIISLQTQAHRHETSLMEMRLQEQQSQAQLNHETRERKTIFEQLNNQLLNLQKEQAVSQDSLSQIRTDIQTINKVMTNTKARGNWGEYQLDALLKIYAGENPNVFSTQYTLKNGKIADAIFHIPGSDKVLCIDSKFPMENYIRMEEEPEQAEYYSRLLKANMKKHIDDISAKYITSETVDQAILFIPSESIYQFVCGKMEKTFSYALSKHVLLTSPTTLVGVIFTLLSSMKDFYRSSHIKEIEKNILMLQTDVDRLLERNEKVKKTLDTLNNQTGLVYTSSQKIAQRMEKIAQGKEETE